jgi:hypothetical protein
MIIKYHSQTPGTPVRQWNIERKGFEMLDSAGNRWRIQDADHDGFQIMTVEDSQGGTPRLNVVPVTGNAVEVEIRS